MPGVKGMRILKRSHPGCNEYSFGKKERLRSRKPWTFRPGKAKQVWGFKPLRDKLEAMYEDMKRRGIDSKQHYLDLAVDCLLEQQLEDTHSELPAVAIEAFESAIAQKREAISREKKLKKPNQSFIEQWEAEIGQLVNLLE